ncbi:DEAD/DEAH box helicase [Bremerella cremea]|uniref:Helicase n=2 Tax=Pirellulales TaxID=2691354 RepID=A0A2S8G057_9BACT|nr:hypothetical protein C5Y83_07750 [Blastopirellula marina]RCS50215.1 DEAD/DEAH box helicase [Bremerella cremea]
MSKPASLSSLLEILRQQVLDSRTGLKRIRKQTLMKKLGYARLTAKRKDDIDTELERLGLVLRAPGLTNWSDAKDSKNLTLELATSSQELPSDLETVSPLSQSESFHSEFTTSWSDSSESFLESAPSTPKRNSTQATSPKQKARTNTRIVSVQTTGSPPRLFNHQQTAIKTLQKVVPEDQPYAGLLVIPTGGGKTRTAVEWLLRSHIRHGGRVIWIAHRTELLNQAFDAFQRNAYTTIVGDRDSIRCHLISGMHDQPVNLSPDDDVVIASVHSLRPESVGGKQFVKKWLSHQSNVILVIDEAHHTPARSYRLLIELIREHAKPLRLLGLTATPFRTAKREQGHLAKLFPNDISYKVNLRELIRKGILSEPIFSSLSTNVSLKSGLSLSEQAKLERYQFDWNRLDARSKTTIGENRVRNRRIVDEYCQNENKYKQTIVFALNVPNAIALHSLFQEKKISAEYVIGNISDWKGTRSISPQHNQEAIQKFKDGEVKVLINVGVLTEGTDLPSTQTVFLARPTTSRTLMMQMIGRGLRGPKAGGTPHTHIVSFLDDNDWGDQVVWVNPEQLFIEENVDFNDKAAETKKRLVRLISIDMFQQFALMLDEVADKEALAQLPFLERIPLGIYSLSLIPRSAESVERHTDILVYSSNRDAFQHFLDELPRLLTAHIVSEDKNSDWLDDQIAYELADIAEEQFFVGVDKIPGYRREDLVDLIQYYHIYGQVSEFIELSERKNYDVDRVAQEIFDHSLGGAEKVKFLKNTWNEGEKPWRAFFNFDEKTFLNEVNAGLQRIENPELFAAPSQVSQVSYPQESLEKFTLGELRETHREVVTICYFKG